MNCPICFASAGSTKDCTEPSFEDLVKMLQMMTSINQIPFCVQFSGGEPTVRDDLPQLIKAAKDMGIPQIQVATNGKDSLKTKIT